MLNYCKLFTLWSAQIIAQFNLFAGYFSAMIYTIHDPLLPSPF